MIRKRCTRLLMPMSSASSLRRSKQFTVLAKKLRRFDTKLDRTSAYGDQGPTVHPSCRKLVDELPLDGDMPESGPNSETRKTPQMGHSRRMEHVCITDSISIY